VRRIIRALEVFEKTGQPISRLQRQFATPRAAAECRVFSLDWPRAELNRRIDKRVEAMFASGLVDEVRRLTAGGRHLSRTAEQALGYREVLAYLASELDLAATIQLVKTRTRQFAKRQRTWFRSLAECRFVPVSPTDTSAALAERIVSRTNA
jgi:tRNA dimethylallyltransferase